MSDDPRGGPASQEDYVPEDDAVIGRVFRWSLVVIVVAAVLGFVAYRWLRPGAPVEQVLTKDVGRVSDLVRDTAAMPQVRFVDVTTKAGIDFEHFNGARGEKLLPETMGSGAAFFDYDGDTDADLLLVNATAWPDAPASTPSPTPTLYRNDGGWSFVNVTAEAGLGKGLYGMGAAVADYDADGDVDLFMTAVGPDRLLRNEGGRFEDVTARAGVAGSADSWSSCAGFFDYDSDGDLDLFVCNYVKWSKPIDMELNFTLNGRDRAYGPPTNFEGTYPSLYRNDGDGKFTDVSAEAGIQIDNPLNARPMGKALGLYFADLDRDGGMDVIVANDTVQNFLFHNQRNGRFEEIGARAGVGFDGAGNARGAMGIDAGHYRNDDLLAIGIGNFANEMTALYVGRGESLQFTDEAAGEGIGSPSRTVLKFGLFFFDYDLDGRLDMLEANGHLEEEINTVQASQHYRQPAQLFWNSGPDARSCFAEVPAATLGDLSRPIVGRGATYADLDGDGDLDVLLTQTGGPPLLLRNDQSLGHHWLRVSLIGAGGNRDAIGAWVELAAGGVRQRRQVMPTRSYLSQVELPLTFGLGKVDRIDSLRVIWPDGTVEDLGAPAVDRLIQARQGAGLSS